MAEDESKGAAGDAQNKGFIAKFTVLRTAPRELWVIYATKVLEILAYGLMSSTLVLWLSADLGFTDAEAGDTIAIWSTLLTLFTVAVGSLTDAVGLRKAFLAGFLICLASRGVMTATAEPWLVLPLGFFPLAIGLAMMVPVMTAALKRYSNTAQRSMAFSMFYVLMNVGFVIAGWLFDLVREELGEYGTYTLPLLGEISTYRVLFAMATVATVPGLLITWRYLRSGVEMTEEGIKRLPPRENPFAGYPFVQRVALSMWDVLKKTGKIFAECWTEKAFYKFLLFLLLVTMVRLVFYHMHYTFPKYGIRELGPGAPIGNLWSVLNPAIIVVLVPIIGVLTQKISSYTMVFWGTLTGSVATFFLAVDPTIFAGLVDTPIGAGIAAWLDLDPGAFDPLYVSITVFVVIFSIGEALWSPRLYEYTAAIAPHGREGSYMALSLLPYFFAKLGVGILSGRLLEAYCPGDPALAARYLVDKFGMSAEALAKLPQKNLLPLLAEKLDWVAAGTKELSDDIYHRLWTLLAENDQRDSETLWLIIAVMAVICPIGLLLGRRWIRVHEEGRDD